MTKIVFTFYPSIGIRIFTKFDVLHLTQKFYFGKIQDKTKQMLSERTVVLECAYIDRNS